jgi:nucleoside-diphosphate-sugar epimerase
MRRTVHVFVTGAGGFSGSQLTLALLARGMRVTAHVGSGTGRLPEDAVQRGDLRIVRGDLGQGVDFAEPVDAVVHAAARSAWTGVSVDDMVRDNVMATRALIAAARRAGVATFILFSSLSVHGRITVPEVDEHTPIVDPDAYGISKRLCELMLEEATGDMRAVALRLPGVLGPGSVRNWLTMSLRRARAGEPVTVFDPVAEFNHAVHVADLARFTAQLVAGDWQGFAAMPLGAAGMTTAGAVARRLAAAGAPEAAVVVGGAPRPGYVISSALAQSRFGYAPMDIMTMLERFIAENP